jgi:ribonuclease E
MLDEHDTSETSTATAAPPVDADTGSSGSDTASDSAAPAKKTAKKASARKTTAKKATKKTTKKVAEPGTGSDADANAASTAAASEPAEGDAKPARKAAKKSAKKTSAKAETSADAPPEADKKPKKASKKSSAKAAASEGGGETAADDSGSAAGALAMPLFKAPEPTTARRSSRKTRPEETDDTAAPTEDTGPDDQESGEDGGSGRRRRSRGGRNRRKSGGESDQAAEGDDKDEKDAKDAKGRKDSKGGKAKSAKAGSKDAQEAKDDDSGEDESGSATSRRRRRRRRSGEDSGNGQDDPAGSTTTRVRQPRAKKESITSVEGSTRIEAKKQRRREGREAGRRRPPILSESEFLARREAVERVMAIRQRGEITQIAVLEDNVLVEHYVALESQSSIIGNVYLGRVQNVLPSMEAAFIDIGKGRNAVLYAGEVNWDLRDDKNQPRRIENALKPGQSVLVQVSKDPIGHKGARLTSQISLPGRYLVYVPGGGTSGISRKLPDTERNRLKNLLKDILPEDAGVIIRTAAEGASEDELTRDVTRLTARWEDIDKKSKNGQAPQLLYAEPDTTLKVVRDLFTEDFAKLVISGDEAWDMVDGYVQHVAPDLAERLERYNGDKDVFASFRIEEQIAKALERKVWLPSGGSLVIDRTEAMTVVDVNTGKFTGSGGNLEETVTKNNLEAAEEIVRQLRLRDIGGIIVIDFIDMVLENNRDLVLRRLVECLGRDRTRHQVAEVTSLGLVQMTRKRISTGLLEAFSHACEQCQGRGVVIEGEPVDPKKHEEHQHGSNGSRSSRRASGRRRGRRGGGEGDGDHQGDESAESSDTAGDGKGDSAASDTSDQQSEAKAEPKAESRSDAGAKSDSKSDSKSEQLADAKSDHAAGDKTDKPDTNQASSNGSASSATASSGRSLRDEADELPSATTPRGRRRRRASRPSGAPSSSS